MNRWPNGISQAKFSAGTFRFIQELKGIKYSNITEFPIQEKLEILINSVKGLVCTQFPFKNTYGLDFTLNYEEYGYPDIELVYPSMQIGAYHNITDAIDGMLKILYTMLSSYTYAQILVQCSYKKFMVPCDFNLRLCDIYKNELSTVYPDDNFFLSLEKIIFHINYDTENNKELCILPRVICTYYRTNDNSAKTIRDSITIDSALNYNLNTPIDLDYKNY